MSGDEDGEDGAVCSVQGCERRGNGEGRESEQNEVCRKRCTR